MKKIILFLMLPFFLFSCQEEEIKIDEEDIVKETISLSAEADGNSIELTVSSSAINKMENIVIHWGTNAYELTNKIELNSNTNYTLTGLPEDDYYFRVTADYYDSTYNQDFSIESSLVECSIELPKDLSTDDAVDLGLSVLWAKCDLGAENPWEHGIQCVWGDPSGLLEEYCDETLCGGAIPPIEISGTSLDIATIKLGNGWRLPTKEECEELETKTELSSVYLRNQKGVLFKAENGNELFMPVESNYKKEYWCGTLNEKYNDAYYMKLNCSPYSTPMYVSYNDRHYLCYVRPVRDRNYVPSGNNNNSENNNGGNNTGTGTGNTGSGTGSGGDNGESGTCTINGYEYVDLGLPSGVKWATCNVGASSPEEYGNYYAWGEISTKSSYSESNSRTYGMEHGDISGNPEYDAATANWGGSWRMPTGAEFDELLNNCNWEWTSQGGHNGYKLTSKRNRKSIFLPAAGCYQGTSIKDVGDIGSDYGSYWSSTPYSTDYGAYCIFFDSGVSCMDLSRRCDGCSIRPVSD